MSEGEWRVERSQEARRIRPFRVLASPWTQRHFLYEGYVRLLDALADRDRYLVVPLRDLAAAPRDRVVVGLRHDVEERMDNALDIARLEAERGLPASYFILHTAPYYGRTGWRRAEHDEALIPRLQELQGLGHEVGWHHDLVTLQCVYDVEPRAYLAGELAWLREHGIDVRGCAKHGSYWCHALGFDNNYFFMDFDEVDPDFPNSEVLELDGRRCRLAKGRLEEFGLEYEAYHLDNDHYFSDGRYDDEGRRWHTDQLDLEGLSPGDKVIVLTHPDYWHASVAAKTAATLARAARRVVTGKRA